MYALPSLAPRFKQQLIQGVAVLSAAAVITSATAWQQTQASAVPHRSVDRLKERIEKLHPAADTQLAMASAVDRQSLLHASVTVTFVTETGSVIPTSAYTFRVQDHPEWVVFYPETSGFVVSQQAIYSTLDRMHTEMLPGVRDAVADQSVTRFVERMKISGRPQEGHRIDLSGAVSAIHSALMKGQTGAVITATHSQPVLYVRTQSGTLQLQRLSRGISNFKGSALGRKANVVKALESQLNGVVIPAREAFSFTQAMRGAGSWENAYVIVNGGELVMEPGGGICQSATTAFRAMLLAGFPIEKQKNHSLYVTYYRAYGVGIDATYYPGKQDLSFRNDTDHPLVMVAYADGDMAVVELYGIPDGRTVDLHGPYFSGKTDSIADARGLSLKSNQIGWLYNVTYPDGRIVEDDVISTYRAIPRSLRDEYDIFPGKAELLGLTGMGGIKQ